MAVATKIRATKRRGYTNTRLQKRRGYTMMWLHNDSSEAEDLTLRRPIKFTSLEIKSIMSLRGHFHVIRVRSVLGPRILAKHAREQDLYRYWSWPLASQVARPRPTVGRIINKAGKRDSGSQSQHNCY
ncbi:hypothetical protein J6590_020976 [Homalodisca vitripennis]|nr:hypothetical protein J6590_020976 [Homalodisca vitripennis]